MKINKLAADGNNILREYFFPFGLKRLDIEEKYYGLDEFE